MKVKKSLKLKPLHVLDGNWTKIANTMFKNIENIYAFKVYCYLCCRYNNQYQYAFPSLSTISEECHISLSSVKRAIKYLEDYRFVVKYKRKEGEWYNNCYYVRYVVEDKEENHKQEENIIESLEEILADELEREIEIFVDEDGNIREK